MSLPLEGTWYNELGSEMVLEATEDGSNGYALSGTYNSQVGDAKYDYVIAGRSVGPEDGLPDDYALSWSVAWQNGSFGNSRSATGWSGQYQIIDGQEAIVAFWLLTSETSESQDWAATQVGKDVFYRNPPTEEEISANRKRGVNASHGH